MRKPYRRHRARMKSRSQPAPEQLELPFDYWPLALACRPQNPSRWIDRPARLWPSRPATKPAKRVQTYNAPASSFLDNIKEKVRQRHPFCLTSHISAIMVDVIRKGWRRHVPAFPPLATARTLSLAKVARMSEDEAREAYKQIRWSATGGDPICPRCGCLGVYELERPAAFKCKACDHNSASRRDHLRQPQDAAPRHPGGHRHLRERREGPQRATTQPRSGLPIQDGLRPVPQAPRSPGR